jgi:hypothetical protein
MTYFDKVIARIEAATEVNRELLRSTREYRYYANGLAIDPDCVWFKSALVPLNNAEIELAYIAVQNHENNLKFSKQKEALSQL